MACLHQAARNELLVAQETGAKLNQQVELKGVELAAQRTLGENKSASSAARAEDSAQELAMVRKNESALAGELESLNEEVKQLRWKLSSAETLTHTLA